MKREKFNSKFWEICGSDELKPNQTCVYFTKGKLYTTDGNMVLIQALILHNFTDDDIENLEGRMVHKEVFKSIKALDIAYPELVQFLPDTIEVRASSGKIYYSYYETNPYEIESVIKGFQEMEPKEIDKIGINTDMIKKLSNAMVSTAIILNFKGKDKVIKITSDGYTEDEQVAYVMPMRITDASTFQPIKEKSDMTVSITTGDGKTTGEIPIDKFYKGMEKLGGKKQ